MLPKGHFSVHLAPKRAIWHVLAPKGALWQMLATGYLCDMVQLVPVKLGSRETMMAGIVQWMLSNGCFQTALMCRGIAGQSFQINPFGALVYNAREYWIILHRINRQKFVHLQENYLNKMPVTNNACKSHQKAVFCIPYCGSLKEIYYKILCMYSCCWLFLSLIFLGIIFPAKVSLIMCRNTKKCPFTH